MSQEPIKKRVCRAKAKAIKLLKSAGYKVVRSDNETFCVIATRRREVRFIRVVIDSITASDRRIVSSIDLPSSNCSREIYCLRDSDFIIEEIETRVMSSMDTPSA
jgi:hypothetical protein